MPIHGVKGAEAESAFDAAHNLTTEERKTLAIALEQMKARGLKIPSHRDISTPYGTWSIGPTGYFIKSNGTEYEPNEKQKIFIDSPAARVGMFGGRGSGKALAIDTPIPTPSGWVSIGDLKVGDEVFDENGNPVHVLFCSNVMYGHDCYRITFSDGSNIVADAEHLWTVLSAKGRKSLGRRGQKRKSLKPKKLAPQNKPKYSYETYTTLDIKSNLTADSRGSLNYSVDVAKPIKLSDVDLPVDPYVLGYWLGNGSKAGTTVTIGKYDQIAVLSNIEQIGYTIQSHADPLSFGISNGKEPIHRNEENGQFVSNPDSFYANLELLDVIKHKHIPVCYLRSGVQQRISLMQGLIDSDGYIAEDGSIKYCTSTFELAESFYELCMTLGIKVQMQQGWVTFQGKKFIRYRFSFTYHGEISRLERKQIRVKSKRSQDSRLHRRYIKSVISVESVPVCCIQVDSPSSLYLAGKSFIPTHNTVAGAQKALKKIFEGKSGLVLSPDFENMRLSTWPELRQWIPWDMVAPAHRYRKAETWEAVKPFTLSFMNGAKMYVKGLKDPDSARGPNVNWMWYDEAGRDRSGMGWNIAVAGVRVGENPQAFVTTTPKGTLHWTYKFFIQQEFTEEAQKLLEEFAGDRPFIEYVFASIDENKEHLSPDFYATMLATYPSGWLRQQELEGQFANEEGALGNRAWFDGHILPLPPADVKMRVRYWDLAGTAKKVVGKKSNDPDFTVGSRVSLTTDGKFVIEHQIYGQWTWGTIKQNIVETAINDGPSVPVYIEQEPGSGGVNQVAELQEMIELAGFAVRPHKPIGDKLQRANPWFARAASGLMYMVGGEWNSKFLSELEVFPTDGYHDDTIDAVSGAFQVLTPFKVWKRIKFLHLGMDQEELVEAEA